MAPPQPASNECNLFRERGQTSRGEKTTLSYILFLRCNLGSKSPSYLRSLRNAQLPSPCPGNPLVTLGSRGHVHQSQCPSRTVVPCFKSGPWRKLSGLKLVRSAETLRSKSSAYVASLQPPKLRGNIVQQAARLSKSGMYSQTSMTTLLPFCGRGYMATHLLSAWKPQGGHDEGFDQSELSVVAIPWLISLLAQRYHHVLSNDLNQLRLVHHLAYSAGKE